MTITRNDGKPARKANRLGGQKRNVRPTVKEPKAPAGMIASKSLKTLVKIRRGQRDFRGNLPWEAYCLAPRCKWQSTGHMSKAGALIAARRHRAESKFKKLHGAKEKAA